MNIIGWDYNVGQPWLAPEALFGQQLMGIPADMRKLALKWFDGDLFDKPMKKLVGKVAKQIATNKVVSSGLAQTVGYLSNDIIEALNKRNHVPTGAALIAKDSDIAHWLRSTKAGREATVPLTLASALPSIIRESDAVLWDTRDAALLYAKKLTDGRYAKFVLKLNKKTKLQHNKSRFNETLNTFKTAGVVEAHNLLEPHYEVLQGEIN